VLGSKTMKTSIQIAFALAFASLASAASAGTLYGLDFNASTAGTATVVSINETNAATTALFSFATSSTSAGTGTYNPRGLAFNPITGHLYSVGLNVVSGFDSGLYDIDLSAMSATFAPIAGNLNVEGIDFLPSANSLVVSYDAASYYTTKFAKISTGGVMGASFGLTTTDADTLGIDPITNDLLVYDASNPTGIFSLNRILNPMGLSTAVGLYSGANDPINDRDLASDGGRLFLTDGANLVQFTPSMGGRATVGPYFMSGIHPNIVGIAANPVPEPSAFLALGVGAVALLRRRRK